MPQISATVSNETTSNQNAHVYNVFAGQRHEVAGSPYALAVGEQSPAFMLNASADGSAVIDYRCDGGPSLSNIDVTDGQDIEIR